MNVCFLGGVAREGRIEGTFLHVISSRLVWLPPVGMVEALTRRLSPGTASSPCWIMNRRSLERGSRAAVLNDGSGGAGSGGVDGAGG